jgi:predicted metal-dependent enzyme (double-stranded beta helix superfamily)
MNIRFSRFIEAVNEVVSKESAEVAIIHGVKPALAELIAHDDWLADEYAVPQAHFYQQYLLHCDPAERFSVVSFVWGPGQKTPIHDHTVWGLIGMLRGAETGTRFTRAGEGSALVPGKQLRLEQGQIEVVSPSIGDVHRVANAFDDRTSISIHVYGANIGKVKRHIFDAETGWPKEFISGFSEPAAGART